ncbi:MAG: hypothetical protein U0R64_00805 [Candidatus Nanopelagicales bacterium]
MKSSSASAGRPGMAAAGSVVESAIVRAGLWAGSRLTVGEEASATSASLRATSAGPMGLMGWWRDGRVLAGVDGAPRVSLTVGLPVGRVLSRLTATSLGDRWRRQRPGWTEAGWWDAELRDEVRGLLWLPKGPLLAAELQRVGGVDGRRCVHPHPGRAVDLDGAGGPEYGTPGCPCACQVVLVAAWACAAAWFADKADAAVVAAARPLPQRQLMCVDFPDLGHVTDAGIDVLAPGLRRSGSSLRTYVARLRARAAASEVLSGVVAEGFLPAWQADLLLADLADLEPADRDRIVTAVVNRLRRRHDQQRVGWTFTMIRRYARLQRVALPEDPAAREAHEGRAVTFDDLGDGRARITADLPTATAARVFANLTAWAAGLGHDGDGASVGDRQEKRTLAQKRADVFADLLLMTPNSVTDPAAGTTARPAGSEVALVISAAALLRLADDPAFLPGVGPLDAETARQLAADSRWRAWLTDASGTVVATSPTTYTPTAAVARVVRAREPHCRFPGCRRTRGLDLDHVIPFPRGSTVPENLSGLCRRHHNHKTHGGWRLVDNDPDPDHPDRPPTWTWTDPTGITHTDGHEPTTGA